MNTRALFNTMQCCAAVMLRVILNGSRASNIGVDGLDFRLDRNVLLEGLLILGSSKEHNRGGLLGFSS